MGCGQPGPIKPRHAILAPVTLTSHNILYLLNILSSISSIYSIFSSIYHTTYILYIHICYTIIQSVLNYILLHTAEHYTITENTKLHRLNRTGLTCTSGLPPNSPMDYIFLKGTFEYTVGSCYLHIV